MVILFGSVGCQKDSKQPAVSGGTSDTSGTGGDTDDIPEDAIRLSCANGYNSATAYFTAGYTDGGLELCAFVKDDDIKSDIYYSYGYDDNIEYLVGVKCENAYGWDSGKTLHFLITADGDTFFQRAVTENTFGDSYALDLKCVFGRNFYYEYSLTDYGYKTKVFLGYELFGLDAENRQNLYVCPAMRNTHDYADSTWIPLREGGCNWSNARSFIEVDENGYVIDKSRETQIMFIGDSEFDYNNWLTFDSDISAKGIVNMASAGTKIDGLKRSIQTAVEYMPRNLVICAGIDEISSSSVQDIISGYESVIEEAKRVLPNTQIYIVNLAGTAKQNLSQKVTDINAGINTAASKSGAKVIDVTAKLSDGGMILNRFMAADGLHLNQMGYNVLADIIRDEFNLPGGQSVAFTDGSMYTSTASVKDDGDFILLDGNFDRYTYFSGCGSADFYAETLITAEKVYNGDMYPKFGLVISSDSTTMFFYVDASGGFTANKVGYVFYENNNTWNWQESVESSCNISYSNGNYCALSVLKYGDYLVLKVNGDAVFTLTGLEEKGISGKCDVGILSFNTSLKMTAPLYATENLADYL